jgi:hypothetical protein
MLVRAAVGVDGEDAGHLLIVRMAVTRIGFARCICYDNGEDIVAEWK